MKKFDWKKFGLFFCIYVPITLLTDFFIRDNPFVRYASIKGLSSLLFRAAVFATLLTMVFKNNQNRQ
jgi:hypothetical protein